MLTPFTSKIEFIALSSSRPGSRASQTLAFVGSRVLAGSSLARGAKLHSTYCHNTNCMELAASFKRASQIGATTGSIVLAHSP